MRSHYTGVTLSIVSLTSAHSAELVQCNHTIDYGRLRICINKNEITDYKITATLRTPQAILVSQYIMQVSYPLQGCNFEGFRDTVNLMIKD